MYIGACVYALIAPDTKMYIGQSKQYATRMGQHERGALRHFDGIWEKTTYVYNAIRYHKWKNMHLYIFEIFDKNRPDIQKVLNENGTMNVSDLSQGIYYLHLISKNEHKYIERVTKI